MKPYLVKTPEFVQRMFPRRYWALSKKQHSVYLTFDDGPIPEVTPWVLSVLKKQQAKATFFCIGDNIQKHPEIFKTILEDGHNIGNHTYNHLNGRKTNSLNYINNVQKAEETILKFEDVKPPKYMKLFRPPYGKLTSTQAKILQKNGYKIIMWDVLSADFDQTISEEKCLQNVLNNIQAGAIVVFHDSLKAEKKLRYVLPKILNYISEKGWDCRSIDI